jgi:UDP-glucose 4-epimerase
VSRVVLVTGVSGYLGSRVAGRLSADPGVERIIGVDTMPPTRADLELLGRTEFVRADIRSPLIAKVIKQAEVDTVVHAAITANPHSAGGRTPMKELNVIGTMQLLAACQKSTTVRRFVLKSTTAVYGASPRDPAVFTEDLPAKALPRSGYGKDAVEVESYVRGFGRRRPDIAVTVLRFANFVGPQVDTTLTRYFALPILPTALGRDPRLQVVHEADAVEVARRASLSDIPGVFNVAGGGALLLSQAVRRAGRIGVPLIGPAVSLAGSALRRLGLADVTPDQLQFLYFGRVVDITKLIDEFGYEPAFTTEQAFDSFITQAGIQPVVSRQTVRKVEKSAVRLLSTGARVGQRAARSVGNGPANVTTPGRKRPVRSTSGVGNG